MYQCTHAISYGICSISLPNMLHLDSNSIQNEVETLLSRSTLHTRRYAANRRIVKNDWQFHIHLVRANTKWFAPFIRIECICIASVASAETASNASIWICSACAKLFHFDVSTCCSMHYDGDNSICDKYFKSPMAREDGGNGVKLSPVWTLCTLIESIEYAHCACATPWSTMVWYLFGSLLSRWWSQRRCVQHSNTPFFLRNCWNHKRGSKQLSPQFFIPKMKGGRALAFYKSLNGENCPEFMTFCLRIFKRSMDNDIRLSIKDCPIQMDYAFPNRKNTYLVENETGMEI